MTAADPGIQTTPSLPSFVPPFGTSALHYVPERITSLSTMSETALHMGLGKYSKTEKTVGVRVSSLFRTIFPHLYSQRSPLPYTEKGSIEKPCRFVRQVLIRLPTQEFIPSQLTDATCTDCSHCAILAIVKGRFAFTDLHYRGTLSMWALAVAGKNELVVSLFIHHHFITADPALDKSLYCLRCFEMTAWWRLSVGLCLEQRTPYNGIIIFCINGNFLDSVLAPNYWPNHW